MSRKVQDGTEKLFSAFDEALEDGDYELAEAALRLIEVSIMLRPEGVPSTQAAMDELVKSYSHLWRVRHPQAIAA